MASEKVWEGVLKILRYSAHYHIGNHADADDLVQDAAQTTFEKLKNQSELAEKSQGESFIKKYAGGVLFNKTRSYYRKLRNRKRGYDALDMTVPKVQEAEAHTRLEKNEFMRQIEDVLRTLNDEDKLLFQMFKKKLTNAEICTTLRIDAETLRKDRQRLIRRLRRELDKRRKAANKGISNGT